MLRHELLEADEARAVLQLASPKFEVLVSSGQLPSFRSGGRICFRREDVAALARKTQALAPKRGISPAVAPKDDEKESIPPVIKPPATAAQKKARPQRRGRWLLVALVCVPVGIASVTFFQTRQQPSAPVNARSLLTVEAPFANSVVAPGLVESASGVLNLAFEIPGTLKRVSIVEGQRVRAGEVIAELENGDIQANLAAAQADLHAAEAAYKVLVGNLAAEGLRAQCEVDRLKAESAMLETGYRPEEIAQAKADVKVAEADANRAAEEVQKYTDPSDRWTNWPKQLFDQARRLHEAALARVDSAKARARQMEAGFRQEDKAKANAALGSAQADLDRVTQTRQARLDSAQAQIAQAQARVKQAEAQLKKTTLVVPIDSVIVWQFLHTGETVATLPTTPVAALADCQQLRVRADVDEADYPHVSPGQRVKVTADAFPGQCFEGRVETVCASAGSKNFNTGEARERRDVKVVETVVKLDMPCPLKLGLRVTAYFEMAR